MSKEAIDRRMTNLADKLLEEVEHGADPGSIAQQLLQRARQAILDELRDDPRPRCGKCEFPIAGNGNLQCTQCKKEWCCSECCCNDDSLDSRTFNKLYDTEQLPPMTEIVCCKCSGKKPCWQS